jgi:hypothetical protein
MRWCARPKKKPGRSGYDETVRRRIINAIAVLSALIFIAVVVDWRLHYRDFAIIEWSRGTDAKSRTRAAIYLQSIHGTIAIGHTVESYGRDMNAPAAGFQFNGPLLMPFDFINSIDRRWIGPTRADYTCSTSPFATIRISARGFEIPNWLLALLFALLPAGWFHRRRRQRQLAKRLAAGLCPSCGYDLRATPERCPECGTSVVTIARSSPV